MVRIKKLMLSVLCLVSSVFFSACGISGPLYIAEDPSAVMAGTRKAEVQTVTEEKKDTKSDLSSETYIESDTADNDDNASVRTQVVIKNPK